MAGDGIGRLVPDSKNANRGTVRGRALLEDSLRKYGAGRSILADKHGNIIAGNKTLESAVDIGLPVRFIETDGTELVVVQRRDLDLYEDKAARELAYTDNRSGELSLDWDVARLLEDRDAGLDLTAVGFTDAELAELLAGVETRTEGLTDPDAVPGVPEVPVTQPGDLWVLGRHRLLCGDSTDPLFVERVLDGKRAQATITDPPFMVRDDDWDTFADGEEFAEFTGDWLTLASTASDVVALFFADRWVPLLRAEAAKREIPYRRALIWRKPPGSQFAGASLDGFWFDFEIIQVFGKPTYKPDKHTRMAVLEHRTVTGQEHGCEKPVELLVELIEGYSERGALLFEPFAGVGTTHIAAEMSGRSCYGIELSPKNCDVIVTRWRDFTGGKAVRQ
jgi:hypothetical protein